MKQRKVKKFLEKDKRKQAEVIKQEITPSNKKTLSAAVILIIILGFAVYGNSINGDFIWDDNDLIENNIYIKNWSNVSNIFTKHIRAGAGMRGNFYRPIQMFSYMIDYSIWKLDVKGYHLTNILLHILTALAIFWFVNILFNDLLLSFITSALFVVHPVHTEAVSYISGRADSLALLFMVLCFIFYIKRLRSRTGLLYIFIALTCILAILSRENSIILVALLFLHHRSFNRKLKAGLFLSVLGIVFFYVLIRTTALKDALPSIACDTAIWQRIPGFFVAITNYIRLLILPVNLHMEYGNPLFSLTHPKALLGLMALSLLIIYIIRKRTAPEGIVFFSLCWFLITILPHSNLYPINAYMAEHWLYVPSIGFFLLIAKFFCHMYRTKNIKVIIIMFIIGLVTFYSYLTIRQNTYWREPLAFYERTLHYAPDSVRTCNNLGNLYRTMDRKEEAIALIKRAIEIDPEYAETYYNLGVIYFDIGENSQAISSYRKAIEINPGYTQARNNLSLAYINIGKKKEAIVMLTEAIERDPGHIGVYNNLGLAYISVGKKKEAIAILNEAIERDPNYLEAYNNLSLAYIDTGNNKKALATAKKAVKLNSGLPQSYYNLGNTYNTLGQKREAMASYKRAIAVDSDYSKAYYGLGNIYSKNGENKKAIVFYKKAISSDPEYAQAYNNLGIAHDSIGERKQAIASFNKAVELKPNLSDAHNNLALAYYYDGRYVLSIRHCDRAVELGHKVNPELLELLKSYRKKVDSKQ